MDLKHLGLWEGKGGQKDGPMINRLGRAPCYALCGDPNGELNLWFSNVYSFYNLVAKVKNRHLSPLFKSVYYSKNMLPAHLNHCPGKKLNVDWILEETGKQGVRKRPLNGSLITLMVASATGKEALQRPLLLSFLQSPHLTAWRGGAGRCQRPGK